MKRTVSFILILCMVLSLAACGAPVKEPDNPSTKQTDPQTELVEDTDNHYSFANGVTAQFMEAPNPDIEPTIPEETQTIPIRGNSSDGPGLFLNTELQNCGTPETHRPIEMGPIYTVYPHTEGTIQAKMDIYRYISPENLPAEAVSYILMVLADGVPMEFTVNGTKYLQYFLSVGEEHVPLELEFEPEFDLHLGRLDFISIYIGNDVFGGFIRSETMWIAQEDDPVRPSTALEVLDNDGITRQQGACRQELCGYGDSATLPNGSDVTYDVITYWEGLYRTLVFFNYRPLTFTVEGVEHPVLDWENNGSQMLEIPFKLPEVSDDKAPIFSYIIPVVTWEEMSTYTYFSTETPPTIITFS